MPGRPSRKEGPKDGTTGDRYNARARKRTRQIAEAEEAVRLYGPQGANPVGAWTPELQVEICQLVAAGAPLPLACPAAGISWRTVEQWLSEGYRDRQPYAGFVLAVERARANHAVGSAMRLTKAGKRGAWQADLAVMERRHPEYYGRRFVHEDVPPGKHLPKHAEMAEALSDEELEKIARGEA